MSPLNEDILVLCTRVISGEASEEERVLLEEMLQDPDYRAYFEEISAQWRAWKAAETPHFDPRAGYARLQARLAASHSARASAPASATVVPFPRQPRRWVRWLVAAAAVVALGVSLWQMPHNSSPVETPWVQRAARAGENIVVQLDDGTRVTLNGRSTLTFPKTFGATRPVRLQGEAYFEVVHDPARPFVVEAGGLKTTVLGTKFNVTALPGVAARVALVEGRVQLESLDANDNSAVVILQPGQRYIAGKNFSQGRVTGFDPEAVLGWMQGVLVFRDEPLSAVAGKLENRFGVTFEITDAALAAKAINARFEKESLAEILEILSFAGGIRCETVTENGAVVRVKIGTSSPTPDGR